MHVFAVCQAGSLRWRVRMRQQRLHRCTSTLWRDVTDRSYSLEKVGLGMGLDDERPGAHALQVPNGELTAKQLRFCAGCIEPYGEKGCADITTRANLQLRGVTLGEADQIMEARPPPARNPTARLCR
jgi:ferredoxin-nitrite reductase